MDAFVKLAVEIHEAVVKRIFERRLIIGRGHGFAHAGKQAEFVDPFADFRKGIIAGGIQLKRLADKRGFCRIGNDAPLVAVIDIADGRAARPATVAQFLAATALDVFGKIINVVFALAEGDVEHEFAVGAWLKAKRGEAQIFDFAGVHQIYNPAAVNAVAGKAVGMPRENALGFVFFNFAQHEIELRASRLLCRATFLKDADDGQALALGEFMQFKKLRLD